MKVIRGLKVEAKPTPIKHKGAYLLLYTVAELGDNLEILILDVGDHSILNNDYSDFK